MTTHVIEFLGSPSDSVREIQTQDGTLLLDVRQGLCLGLSVVGAIIWSRLRHNENIEQITRHLASRFSDVSTQEIHDDAVHFIRDIQEKGMLVSGDQACAPIRLPRLLTFLQSNPQALRENHRQTRFLFWKALLGLLTYDVFGFGKNFSKVHAGVGNWPVSPLTPRPDAVERVCHAINHACLWYPKRVLCLQRSAVTTCLLRNCGVPAQMTIGAQRFPFRAHAWTEVSGQPINERREVQSVYLLWDRC
jgi:Transglutaminase-like superfamily/Coenzyme PQQ synthesis protein D (PqqD)